MATDNPTAIPSPESESDGFGVLEHRLFSLISRLQCVVKNFDEDDDWPGLVNELHPSAFVLGETVEDLLNLHSDLEQWHSAHEHTPKAPKAAQS